MQLLEQMVEGRERSRGPLPRACCLTSHHLSAHMGSLSCLRFPASTAFFDDDDGDEDEDKEILHSPALSSKTHNSQD